MMVQWGSLVWLDYDLILDSGEQIDSSEVNGPLRFRVGDWRALRGLPEKLVGLREGDERLIRLSPAEAFGEWDLDAILTLPANRLVGDKPLEDGMAVEAELPFCAKAKCRVYRLPGGQVALDFNHPFAGQPLTLFVRVRRVLPPTQEGSEVAA